MITGLPKHNATRHRALGCRLYRSTDKTGVVTGTVTPIDFDAEDYDDLTFHDNATNNTRATIPTGYDGRYEVQGTVQYATNATGERRARIHKNGSVIKQNNKMTVTVAGEVTFVECNATLNLVAGDYIELAAYHTVGSDHTVTGGASNTQLILVYLGRAS